MKKADMQGAQGGAAVLTAWKEGRASSGYRLLLGLLMSFSKSDMLQGISEASC